MCYVTETPGAVMRELSVLPLLTKKASGSPRAGKDNPVGMGSFESIGLAKNSPNPFIYWTGAILDRITFVFISHAHQLF